MKSRKRLAVAAIAATSLFLSGCTGGTPPPTPVEVEWQTRTPTATGSVDQVTWNLPYGEPSTLHWLQAAAYSESTVLSAVCEGLLRLSPEFTLEPGIATWESPDDTTFVYTLFDGVVFSDGTPVTAEDVVFSLATNLDPESGSFWGEWFSNVESITATGEREVTVTLTTADALFNQIMGTAASIVVKKEFVEASGDDYGTSLGGLMCTGPFELSKWTPGESIELTANPSYWDTEHQPQVSKLDFRFITNRNTLTDALRTGEIDGSYEVPFSAIRALDQASGGKLYYGDSLSLAEVLFYGNDGLGQNPDVRKAISLILDRTAISDTIFQGAARPIWAPFFESTWGESASVYAPAYEGLRPEQAVDLDAARELLAAVDNLDQPMRLLSNADDPSGKQLAAYLQSQAQQVGLTVELVELPSAQYIAVAFDPELQSAYDLGVSTTSYIDIPSPTLWATFIALSGGWFNTLPYDNAQVDGWIGEARAELDPDKRAEIMVSVLNQVWGQDTVTIPLVQVASVMYMNDRITGANPTLNAHLYYPWARDLGASE